MIRGSMSVLASLLVTAFVAFAPAAHAGEAEARELIENISAKTVEILADGGLSQQAKIDRFDTLLSRDVDMGRVARFVLGRYRRQIEANQPDKMDEYVELYRKYLIYSRASQLSALNVRSIDVVGVTPLTKNQYMVNSAVTLNDGSQQADLGWRVREEDGEYKIIDLVVAGVSMGQSEREANVPTLQSSGGDIQPLLAKMRAKISELGGSS